MTLPVSTDVYLTRFVWESSSGPRPASHQLHFLDAAGTQDAVALGVDLLANLTANCWRLVSSTASIRQILITPLDGLSSTYSVPITIGNANISGSGTGDPIPQGAMVLSVVSAVRGKQWRNRSYVPFVGEAEQNAGVLTTGSVTTAQTAWTTFYSAMVAQNWTPEVIAPSEAEPVANQRAAVRYTVRPYLKTQRRRARR